MATLVGMTGDHRRPLRAGIAPFAALAAVTLAARAITALAQFDGGPGRAAAMTSDAGTSDAMDAALSIAGNDARPWSSAPDVSAMSPEDRRRFRVPIGAFRAAESRGPIVGVWFERASATPRLGRLTVLWRLPRPRGATDFVAGEYRVERSSVQTRDAAAREGTIGFEWEGEQMRLRFERVTALFDRVASVCRNANDCVAQAATAPELECARTVGWSCDPRGHACMAHCGPPARSPGLQRCGPHWCPPGEFCCNTLMGTCVPPGGGCGQ